MKRLSCFVIAIVLVSVFACEQSKNETSSALNRFDYTGYQTEELSDGLIRVFKTDSEGDLTEEGYIKNGQQNGVWVTYENDAISSTTAYIDGKKNGKHLEYDFRQQLIEEATYKNGILHGKKGSYKRGKPLVVAWYIDGEMNGKFLKYFETGTSQGKLSQYAQYKDGKLHGKMYYYNDKGEITVEYQYQNGEKISGGIK